MPDTLKQDLEGTRSRIETLRSQLADAEQRLAELRNVEQAQLEDRVAGYQKMTPAERVRLREESPAAFFAIMEATREAGERRLYGEAGQ